MITFRAEETIARPASEVFELAVDVENHPRWMNVLDARSISGRPSEVGSRARERVRFGPRQLDIDMEVTDVAPGRLVTWRWGSGAPMAGHATLALEPLGPSETRAVWSGSMSLKGLWRLMEPVIRREARAGEAAELRRLKQILESPAAAEASAAQPAPAES